MNNLCLIRNAGVANFEIVCIFEAIALEIVDKGLPEKRRMRMQKFPKLNVK